MIMKAREELIKECLELVSQARSVHLLNSGCCIELIELGEYDTTEGLNKVREHEKKASHALDKLGSYLVAMQYLED